MQPVLAGAAAGPRRDGRRAPGRRSQGASASSAPSTPSTARRTAIPAGCSRCSGTCCRTPSSSRPPAGTCTSTLDRAARRSASRVADTGMGIAPRVPAATCSSASARPTSSTPGRTAASASAWRSSSTCVETARRQDVARRATAPAAARRSRVRLPVGRPGADDGGARADVGPQPRQRLSPATRRSSTGARILVVDDDDRTRDWSAACCASTARGHRRRATPMRRWPSSRRRRHAHPLRHRPAARRRLRALRAVPGGEHACRRSPSPRSPATRTTTAIARRLRRLPREAGRAGGPRRAPAPACSEQPRGGARPSRVGQLGPGRRVVAGVVRPRTARSTPASRSRGAQAGAEQQVVDAQAGVARPAVAQVVPEGVDRLRRDGVRGARRSSPAPAGAR